MPLRPLIVKNANVSVINLKNALWANTGHGKNVTVYNVMKFLVLKAINGIKISAGACVL